ncbi:MAG: anthranilate synthase component I [Candidatus Marinimicrobia bacterium]|nr:anthranilate synthase component I [Candidatus Neomarinimicrobiota bacterium]MCF7828238.1 anthranilate synthase component I [Candidatus Neomarinimicrobiota bacterium]MCF7879587.1 anthranilate synthase component I [Candidatus Neomarinimicrobiota bacterium]
MMTFEQFQRYAKEYTAIPVYKKVLSDLLTPVSAYLRLSKKSTHSVLLESVEEGKQLARYSYIGRDPQVILQHTAGMTTVSKDGNTTMVNERYLDVLREYAGEYQVPKISEIPVFAGGWIGYLGYETITWIENIPTYSPQEDDVPDAVFMLFETLIAFDHVKRETIISHNVKIDRERDLREQYDEAIAVIDEILEDLHTEIEYEAPVTSRNGHVESNMSQEQFESAVEQAKEYVRAGDVYQLVLSQRFQRETGANPFTIYRALRSVNPSPFMFYFNIDDFNIIGASPEVLVKVEDNEMEVRPIAGTRPRGDTVEEDDNYATELLSDEKERAEHLMLVDLARNDVGMVCEYGSVDVQQYMEVERYSHVMHIVSDVRGQIRDEYDAYDALMAGFPAGTVTGAPKIRAMEIIRELEPTRRGIYSGAVGYIDFHDNVTTCITIRTLLMKDQTVYFQSGAGIVYDSVPEKEFTETENKAMAIMRAIDFAEQGLQ